MKQETILALIAVVLVAVVAALVIAQFTIKGGIEAVFKGSGILYGEKRHAEYIARSFADGFDHYGEIFRELKPCEGAQVDKVIVVRLRGFGSPAEKAGAWYNEVSKTSKPPAGATVVRIGEVTELWFDLYAAGAGQCTANHLILGHELSHEMAWSGMNIVDPDWLADPEVWREVQQ